MIMLSPGVYDREVDYSTNVASASSATLGMVGLFNKGKMNTRLLVTSGPDFVRTFGKPMADSYAGLAALQFLSRGNQLWIVRVGDGTEKKATISIPDNAATPNAGIKVEAASEGTWANSLLQVKVSDIDTVSSPKTFTLSVLYDSVEVERFEGVNLVGTDTSGSYLEDAVAKSTYITVDDLNNGTWTNFLAEATHTLTGGTDGTTSVDAGDVTPGLELFSNPDDVNINILCAPGYSEGAVINKGISICEARGDCMYLVDPPFGLTAQNVVDWHNGEGTYTDHQAYNSSYAALYWPWMYIYDDYNKAYRWTPPSGFVAGTYAFNDSVGEPWFAPAGFNRGRLTAPLAVETSATKGQRDFMYSGGNRVNPIVNFPKEGITIWGQETLQRKSSATDRVNVRRLLLMVRKAIALSTQYLTFEQNDRFTWDLWKGMVEPYLANIKARRGLYDFKVIMDETTVTDTNIDRNEMPGKVLLKPTKTAEMIQIDFVLYSTSAKFNS